MNGRLPVVSGSQAVAAFSKAGFSVLPHRGKGSHIILHHAASQILLSIPNHKEVKRGTLRALIRDSGLTVDQFRALL